MATIQDDLSYAKTQLDETKISWEGREEHNWTMQMTWGEMDGAGGRRNKREDQVLQLDCAAAVVVRPGNRLCDSDIGDIK